MKTEIKLFFLGLGIFHSIWYFAVDSGISTNNRPIFLWGKNKRKPNIQVIFFSGDDDDVDLMSETRMESLSYFYNFYSFSL